MTPAERTRRYKARQAAQRAAEQAARLPQDAASQVKAERLMARWRQLEAGLAVPLRTRRDGAPVATTAGRQYHTHRSDAVRATLTDAVPTRSRTALLAAASALDLAPTTPLPDLAWSLLHIAQERRLRGEPLPDGLPAARDAAYLVLRRHPYAVTGRMADPGERGDDGRPFDQRCIMDWKYAAMERWVDDLPGTGSGTW